MCPELCAAKSARSRFLWRHAVQQHAGPEVERGGVELAEDSAANDLVAASGDLVAISVQLRFVGDGSVVFVDASSRLRGAASQWRLAVTT